MIWIAFTLGLFGSLHCVGMCGPLAIAFCGKPDDSKMQRLNSSLFYNFGRTFTYAILGLIFGILGSFIVVVDLQKLLSILLGGILVFAFFMSYDIDETVNKLSPVRNFYQRIRRYLSKMYNRAQQYHPFMLGAANGLLPCGLVYLAIAGAIASGSLINGMVFMTFFGLGTLPMMVALVFGFKMMTPNLRFQFRKVLPYVTLTFGLFLIYRGLVVGMPDELNFWEMMKNPIMCH